MILMILSVFRGFGYALKGIFRTVREERNFRIHLVAVGLVIWFSFLYEVTVGQALMLLIFCTVVLSLELLNTAVERAVDLISPQRHPLAEKAKDAAAGAVLIAAIGSVIGAALLFRDPAHWSLVLEKMSSPVRIVCFVAFVLLALFFVKGRKSSRK